MDHKCDEVLTTEPRYISECLLCLLKKLLYTVCQHSVDDIFYVGSLLRAKIVAMKVVENRCWFLQIIAT